MERAFRRAGEQELADHFTAQAAVIGFGRDNAADLRDAIAGEGYEATTMYPSFAQQARRDRCIAAANLFGEIARDEARHARAFYQGTARPAPVMRPSASTRDSQRDR